MLSLLVNINTLWNRFAVDDQQQVLNSVFIRDLRNLPLAFTSSVWSFGSTDIVFATDPYFRPLFNVLFTLDYALFGTRAWGWHLSSVVIHTAVVLMSFVLLKQISGREWLAAVVASLFAVHPVHAESVAWISGVPDSLMALFLLPAFAFYLRYRNEKSKYLMGTALSLFFLALLSKETALAFPLLIFFSELVYFEEGKSISQRMLRGVARASMFVLPAAIYFGMRYRALGHVLFSGDLRHPFAPAIMSVPLALAKYLVLMVVPIEYSYQHYTDLVQTLASVRFLGPLGLLLGIVAALFTKSRLLRLAIIWFIVFLAPPLAGLRQFDPEYAVQERYLYLPSLGFCLALAIVLEWLVMSGGIRWSGRKAATVMAGILVLILGSVDVFQNRVWHDSITVFRNCVAVAPNSPVAHSSLARVYADAGRAREASQEARIALDLDPASSPAYLVLSYVAFRSHKMDEAASVLQKGLATIPVHSATRAGVATMQLNLGMIYQQQKDTVRAEEQFRQTIQTLPRPVAWYYAGQFYLEQGRYQEAGTMFEEALSHLPGTYAPVYLKLGQVYENLGQGARARACYLKFVELTPRDSPDRERVKQHLMNL